MSIQEKETTAQEPTVRQILPGDQVFVRVFKRKWDTPRREGPYTVVRATTTEVQVEGSPTWYPLNHCTRDLEEEEIGTKNEPPSQKECSEPTATSPTRTTSSIPQEVTWPARVDTYSLEGGDQITIGEKWTVVIKGHIRTTQLTNAIALCVDGMCT